MAEKLVRFEVDLEHLPPLTEAQQAELKALMAKPDSEIDFSDSPRMTDEAWRQARQGVVYRPTKASTTVRIDTDVLAWLRAQGKGYQSRINAILRREMLAALRAQAR